MRLEILYSTVTANTLAQDGSQDGRDRQLFALPVYLGHGHSLCAVLSSLSSTRLPLARGERNRNLSNRVKLAAT